MPTIVRSALLAGLLSLAACSGTPKPAGQAKLRIAGAELARENLLAAHRRGAGPAGARRESPVPWVAVY